MKIAAEWTNDCQGKKDFDGPIVTISTRYWPRGGGYFFLDSTAGTFEGNEARPHVPPSANSSILLRFYGNQDVTLTAKDFTANTEEEVKRQVEEWANAQLERIVSALENEFDVEPEAD